MRNRDWNPSQEHQGVPKRSPIQVQPIDDYTIKPKKIIMYKQFRKLAFMGSID